MNPLRCLEPARFRVFLATVDLDAEPVLDRGGVARFVDLQDGGTTVKNARYDQRMRIRGFDERPARFCALYSGLN
jgi:hypothetical protein